MSACGAVHPSRPEVTCTYEESHTEASHWDRVNDIHWPNPDYQPPRRVAHMPGSRGGRRKAIELAGHVKRPVHAGPPPSPEQIRAHVVTGVPIEAETAWDRDQWVHRAFTTLAAWVREHPGQTFTTPEDIWPLLDCPREKRAMVLPVRKAIRAGLIIEVAAKRLTGVYRTRDGVEFAMNKLVPVYQAGR